MSEYAKWQAGLKRKIKKVAKIRRYIERKIWSERMHLIALVGTYPEHHERFVQWLKSRKYKSKRLWDAEPREWKIYDIVIPKDIEKQVIADLKAFENSRLNKLGFFKRLISFAKRFFGIKEIDKAIKPTPKGALGDRFGWWAYVHILGKVEDAEVYGRENL